MLDFASIPNYDRSKIEVIRSRLRKLDAKIGGFNKGELSVWSGSNASGKSTLVSQLGLAAITEGYKVAVFSGEMTASRVRDCVLRQAAGPENVELDKLNSNHYCLNRALSKNWMLCWLAGYLFTTTTSELIGKSCSVPSTIGSSKTMPLLQSLTT